VIIELILLFITYLAVLILGTYYINLYISQDHFTKEELKNIFPYLANLWSSVTNNNSIPLLLGIIVIFSFLGVLVTMLSDHWFLNSSIIFTIMYLTFPLARKSFDKAKVTTGGGFADTAIDLFLKYYNFILIGYGTGTGTALMYNWGVYKSVPFLWFLINFIVISILLGMIVKNTANS